MRFLPVLLFLVGFLPAQELRLAPPYNDTGLEYSGLAWHRGQLVLLPQYPKDSLPVLERADLHQALRAPRLLHPRTLPFDDAKIRHQLAGYEGYEAIAFEGDRFYALVEGRLLFGGMRGYLVTGRADSSGIVAETCLPLPLPEDVSNYAFEALTLGPEAVYVLYEANGIAKTPFAYAVSRDLATVTKIPIAAIPFRVTDLTALEGGRAWALNTFWTGDRKKLQVQQRENFAQLLELEVGRRGIHPTGRTLEINRGGPSYNWEGITAFEKGVIIITDTYPATIMRYLELTPGTEKSSERP